MNRLPCIALLVCLVSSPTSNAQVFANLDFESGSGGGNQSFALLDWAVAAPGWSHTSGDDTGFVYFRGIHVGLSQWFLLADGVSTQVSSPIQPLQGSFSLAFKSGNSSWVDPGSPWVQAAIFQTAVIPDGADQIHLLATGHFEVRINGTPLSMSLDSPGGNAYTGHLPGFTPGVPAELRIINTASPALGSFEAQSPVTVDGISFTGPGVPEPMSAGIVALALAAGAFLRSRKPSPWGQTHSSSTPRIAMGSNLYC